MAAGDRIELEHRKPSMPEIEPAVQLNEGFSEPGAAAPPWADGRMYFCVGAHEQKARNLESDARCVLAAGANQFRSGLDVVIEGTAVRVAGNAQLQRLAAMWKSELDWDFEV